MAKVYSWQIKKNPVTYSYIVHPDDYDSTYIGYELTGNRLKSVIKWAQNCTEDEYKNQFNKMVQRCKDGNYDVVFEEYSAYINVQSTCDDLRGPSGRGIEKISLLSENVDYSVYQINYSDGTYDTFNVKNGADGIEGKPGKDGKDGMIGVSTRTVDIYISGSVEDDEIKTPNRPTGGHYDFNTYTFKNDTLTKGWVLNPDILTGPIFKSSRTFGTTELSTEKQWSLPYMISGKDGKAGEDGTLIEFIYQLSNVEPEFPDNEKSQNGYVPIGWTASPSGVDENHTTEYMCSRYYNKEHNEWGDWSKPVIWSKYGKNGMDGDGVQYIYKLTKNGTPPDNPTPFDYRDNELYQNKDNEYIPSDGWTDEPMEVSVEMPFQWVSSRKYRLLDKSDKEWSKFSNPTLWSKFGQDYDNMTVIKRLYALSNSTSEAPELPTSNIFTNEWGDGFPVDYKYGENVVWGTEAEIYLHNKEFVCNYVKVSEIKNGEVIPPYNATINNTKLVDELPTEKYYDSDIKYLLYNNDYYEWKGGWCKPFIVTGLKGEDGAPIDYTTYVFAFGLVGHAPGKPNGNTPDKPGFSYDSLNIKRKWFDIPVYKDDNGIITTEYVDGYTDNSGRKYRWYQCIGYVHGENHSIKKWGEVYPCNGIDGSGAKTEFRFKISQTNEKPSLIEIDSQNNVIREPEGWVTTENGLGELEEGCSMWQIWAVINSTNEVELQNGKYWNGPIRISGEKGETGKTGPAGIKGIPGVNFYNMYTLGDEECCFIDIIENDNSKNTQESIDKMKLLGWELGTNIPSTKIIELDTFNPNVSYTGETSIIKYNNNHYFCKNGIIPINLKRTILDSIYIWCTQGTDSWTKGKEGEYIDLNKKPNDANINNTIEINYLPDTKIHDYKYVLYNNVYYIWNQYDGSDVEHTFNGIMWSNPYKAQGTNGAKGEQGKRGQVVFPMGNYNPNTKYYLTDEKAPYVYDTSSGGYYVLNYVGQEGYWLGTEQDNETPGQNYDRLQDSTPSWVKFESFDAIYTSIGVIANGIIGSAVYNNEFMFSQQGIDYNGNPSTYSQIAGIGEQYGFLDGYEYDEIGQDGKHWKYKNTNSFIDDKNVDPYELNSSNNPIHSFRPNICINFKTGEMWVGCGKINFDTSNILLKDNNNKLNSGLSGDSNIAFWAGSTDKNNANIKINKDGTAKIGIFNVKNSSVELALKNNGQCILDKNGVSIKNKGKLLSRMDNNGVYIYDENSEVKTKLIGGNVSLEKMINTGVYDLKKEYNINNYIINTTEPHYENSKNEKDISLIEFDITNPKNTLTVTCGFNINLNTHLFNDEMKDIMLNYWIGIYIVGQTSGREETLYKKDFYYKNDALYGNSFYDDWEGKSLINAGILYVNGINQHFNDLPIDTYTLKVVLDTYSSSNTNLDQIKKVCPDFRMSAEIITNSSKITLSNFEQNTMIGSNGFLTFQSDNHYFGAYTDDKNKFKILCKADEVPW